MQETLQPQLFSERAIESILKRTGEADNDNTAWATFSGSLSAFTGPIIYLLIEAADASTRCLVEAAIDDVVITQ